MTIEESIERIEQLRAAFHSVQDQAPKSYNMCICMSDKTRNTLAAPLYVQFKYRFLGNSIIVSDDRYVISDDKYVIDIYSLVIDNTIEFGKAVIREEQ